MTVDSSISLMMSVQNHGRHLLDITTKTNADASILSGNIGMDTVRQSILGYNQGRNLLQDPTVKVCSPRPAAALFLGLDEGILCTQTR